MLVHDTLENLRTSKHSFEALNVNEASHLGFALEFLVLSLALLHRVSEEDDPGTGDLQRSTEW